MGGNITVSSHLGRGTTFAFDIPLCLGEVPATHKAKRSGSVIGLVEGQPEYRILVVEDVRVNRLLMVKLLTKVGFKVQEAVNGQEALELWSSWSPHLIWMDIQMPVMNGYEATKRIKADPKGQKTVIIALTANAFEEERVAILAAGCDDYASKPFQEEIIFSKMSDRLGVRYIYDLDPEKDRSLSGEKNDYYSDSDGSSSLSASDLAIMPPEWLAQLNRAASELNEKAVFRLIEEVGDNNSSLKSALADLVNNFRLDTIVDLTEQAGVGNE
ncbi:MAG: response regulator [Oscillatoria sp. SIO1A7]|nr:response regulator [Oscillatoria sp. SIO1A7]